MPLGCYRCNRCSWRRGILRARPRRRTSLATSLLATGCGPGLEASCSLNVPGCVRLDAGCTGSSTRSTTRNTSRSFIASIMGARPAGNVDRLRDSGSCPAMYEEFPLLNSSSRTVGVKDAQLRGTRRTQPHQITRVQSNWGSGGREFESPQPDGNNWSSEPVSKGRLSSFVRDMSSSAVAHAAIVHRLRRHRVSGSDQPALRRVSKTAAMFVPWLASSASASVRLALSKRSTFV